jgi:DNA-binding GntR family transcriptional regulator
LSGNFARREAEADMTAPGELAGAMRDLGTAPEDSAPDEQELARALAGQAPAARPQPAHGSGLQALQPTPQMQERRNLSSQVADTLRNAINQGTLADGTALNQVAIAKMLGVSRVPVREAIHRLQAEGLITVRPHHGAVVTGLSVERVSELFEIQALLEEFIARRAAPNIDTATMSRLRSLVAQMRATAELEPWLALNETFHAELSQPSGASLAIELSDQLRSRGQRYLNLWSDGKGIDRTEDADREHELILDFITAGDFSAVCAAVKQHVLTTRDKAIGYHEARTKTGG